MALTTRSPGQSPIDSSAINQFVQVLTGVMTDQPIVFANSLNVNAGGITGSSNLTISGSITGSSALTISGNANVQGALVIVGALTTSSAVSLGSSTVNITGPAKVQFSATSSQRRGVEFGSSGPTILFGSSIPTASALVGSLFFNQGGSSTTAVYVAMPNSGGASSSLWSPFSIL